MKRSVVVKSDFFPFLSPPSFLAERCSKPSRARSLLRQRTLHGEDRSSTIPLGRRRRSAFSAFPLFFLCTQTNAAASLPYALLHRATSSLGASWVFSFQPVLPPDYRNLAMELGQATDAVSDSSCRASYQSSRSFLTCSASEIRMNSRGNCQAHHDIMILVLEFHRRVLPAA